MAEWQPISTAPRDGTFILAHHPSGHINIVQWSERHPYKDSKWRTRVSDIELWMPTHWQPLPTPPQESR